MISLLIYGFAGIDYLCNYGLEIYPLGVVFVGVSLGIIAFAITKFDLLANPMTLAATIAHEMRTPLATIRAQALSVSRYLPILFEGYQRAVEHKLYEPRLRRRELAVLESIGKNIENEVDRSTAIMDLILAASRMDAFDSSDFQTYSVRGCIDMALQRYPFTAGLRQRVQVTGEDFPFYGSDTLLIYVLFNLIKNAAYAIKAVEKGEIRIELIPAHKDNRLVFTDTGTGIAAHVLPHIFDPFYTTKHAGCGTGIGLPFCERVMQAFNGRIGCHTEQGRYTSFLLEFPPARGDLPLAVAVA
jgi:signal transduction histidine kinase